MKWSPRTCKEFITLSMLLLSTSFGPICIATLPRLGTAAAKCKRNFKDEFANMPGTNPQFSQ